MNLKQSLTENLGVKLVALVVAVFIWFNASGQQEMVRLREIPLVVANVPDSLTITGALPAEVEIRVRGTKRQLLIMGFRSVDAIIDLTGARPGRQRVTLTSANVDVPSGFDRRNISVISPGVVDLRLETLLTKRVQVALSTSGSVAGDLLLIDGGPTVEPAWVSVRGPESTIERIKNIPTQTLDLSRLRESGSRVLPLDYDPQLLVCDPTAVTVSVTLSEKRERVLANVPPTILVDSEDLRAVVLPSTVSLTLEGPAAVLDTLSSGDVSVLINLSGRDPAQYKMAPEVILPPGVTLAGISVDTLVIQLAEALPDTATSTP